MVLCWNRNWLIRLKSVNIRIEIGYVLFRMKGIHQYSYVCLNGHIISGVSKIINVLSQETCKIHHVKIISI